MIDWDKPIMWSTNEEASLVSPYRDTLCPLVTACSMWEHYTGSGEVHVDGKTGEILGCEREDYPHIVNRKPPAFRSMSA